MLIHLISSSKNYKLINTFILVFLFSIGHVHAERYDLEVMQEFLSSVEVLGNELELSCQKPNRETLTEAWQQAASGWFLVVGLGLPTVDFMQLDHKVIFWPDSKDRLKNQVLTAMAKTPDQQDKDTLPASVMSLSAIEYILTLDRSSEYCDWLLLIAKQHKSNAEQILSLQKFYEFSTFEQVTALHSSILLSHSQLKEVLSNPNKVNWALAPAWRSDSGWFITQSLAQQIIDLSQLLNVESPELLAAQKRLNNVLQNNESISHEELQQYDAQLVELASYVELTLAPSLDVFLGFNNFDGD